ncbi:hypothetical protein ACNKH9_01015 [Metapseudomonas otitidis]|uniref:hypothetical protein n=1 Tax=Metapseudomonas otitidis TaxID=319939 RepID=UPI003A895F67
MLKAALEHQKKHLRPTNIPNAHVGTVDFDLDANLVDGMLAAKPGNSHRAYYLPWAPDTGYFIDLPDPPTGHNPRLFLTANLTGCCVGVQNFDGFIRVRHYNLFTSGDYNPVFTQDDLFRYGTNISWLLPSDKYNVTAINRASAYSHGGPLAECVIWGEYDSSAQPPKWRFYYQNGNSETDVHELIYQ